MLKARIFDCVSMKREGGRRVYERVKHMTQAQELDYWKERSAQLERKIRAAKRRREA